MKIPAQNGRELKTAFFEPTQPVHDKAYNAPNKPSSADGNISVDGIMPTKMDRANHN